MSVVSSTLGPRWTLHSAPISSQRWYNCRGRMGRGRRRRLWSSSLSSFSHCTSCVPLCPRWLSSPPSLSHYPAPTTGQFVRPAWLPPPLLLRYLAPFLHFNGRYWLENFHDPFAIPPMPPSPSQQPLIWLQAFRSLSEEARPRRTMEDRVVSQTLSSRSPLPFARGAASTLLRHHVPAPPARYWLKKKGHKISALPPGSKQL